MRIADEIGIGREQPRHRMVEAAHQGAVDKETVGDHFPPSHSGMVRKHQTSDVQLHIWETRDSRFDASHRPGMTNRHLPTHFGGRFSENAFGPSM